MPHVPPALLARLKSDEAGALQMFLEDVQRELGSLYRDEVADHHEARGDDAVIFGMKLWHHLWFRLENRYFDNPLIKVVSTNRSWQVQIGPLRIGIYKLGELITDDILGRFPDNSPTKRAYAERNDIQLSMFEDNDFEEALPKSERSWRLNNLTISHFGNPRDGFAKWYFGAQTGAGASQRWDWIERQDMPNDEYGDGAKIIEIRAKSPKSPTSDSIVPFSERPIDDVPVTPRTTPLNVPTDPNE